MWFKRRKKSEQDHALSESLKSLQTLLNDTDRVEPSLERTRPEGEIPAGESRGRPGPAHHERASRRDDAAEDARSRKATAAPADSGNRWRDLSLSFDAEPMPQRGRRGSRSDAEHAPADEAAGLPAQTGDALSAPEEGGEADAGPDGTVAGIGNPDMDHSDGESRLGPTGTPPSEASETDTPLPGIALDEFAPRSADELEIEDAAAEENPVADELETEDVAADQEPVVDPPGNEDAAAGAEEPVVDNLATGDVAAEERPVVDEPDVGGLESAGKTAATGPEGPTEGLGEPDPEVPVEDLEGAMEEIEIIDVSLHQDNDLETAAGGGGEPLTEQEEDQLHLELEPTEGTDDDIPTLTDAVYVPDSLSDGAPPGPGESPYDGNVEQCIDRLRVRLELMGLDTLSPKQERELRDTLLELLDDLRPPGQD